MAEFEESLEDLESKLENYFEQLKLVDNALKETREKIKLNEKSAGNEKTSENEELNTLNTLERLHADLSEVINLTNDLINFKKKQEKKETLQAEDHRTLSGGDEVTIGMVSGEQNEILTLVGRTCQAKYKNEYYFANILQLKKDINGKEKVLVEFIGWKNREEYPLNQIKILVPPHISLCTPGAPIQAIFSQDGRWYDAVIEEQTERGFLVKYEEYGNREEVKFDQIRLKKGLASSSSRPSSSAVPNAMQSAQNKKVLEEEKKKERKNFPIVVTPAGYKIPEYLIIKETDNESEKNQKRRKIAALKKQQRVELLDEQAQKQANAWKSFAIKASKKKLCGYITGKTRESIFKSSDEIVTQKKILKPKQGVSVFVPRRKFDFEEVEE